MTSDAKFWLAALGSVIVALIVARVLHVRYPELVGEYLDASGPGYWFIVMWPFTVALLVLGGVWWLWWRGIARLAAPRIPSVPETSPELEAAHRELDAMLKESQ